MAVRRDRRRAQIALAVAAALAVGLVTTAFWQLVQGQTAESLARWIERDAFATRTHLQRELDSQLQALRSAAGFWSDYGHLPPYQWKGEAARLELSHLRGLERMLWSDPVRDIRYVAAGGTAPSLHHRPPESEWRSLAPLLRDVTSGTGERILGPEPGVDGRPRYRLQIPAQGPGNSGVLVAVIDPARQLHQALAGQSPGHAITVSWDGRVVYRRGTAAPDVPDTWQVRGNVAIDSNARWLVTSVPTESLAARLSGAATPTLLVGGWTVALLVGLVVYFLARARVRAAAAEDARRRYAEINQELQARVEERAHDLDTISHSVAHDIRGPLNVISLNTHLLEMAQPSEQARTAIERISTATTQASDIVNRLQTFSTVTLAELERELVDMTRLAVDASRALSREEDVAVAYLPPCSAQPMLVEALMKHLLASALKYAQAESAPKVVVRAVAGSRPTVYCVQDRASRTEDTTSEAEFRTLDLDDDEHIGGGLNLAIVARIVKRHGGRLRMHSEDGSVAYRFDMGPDSIPAPANHVGAEDHDDPHRFTELSGEKSSVS